MSELRKRRLALGLGQGVLAALAEVNQASISRAESSQFSLPPEAERLIERALRALERIASDRREHGRGLRAGQRAQLAFDQRVAIAASTA